MLWMGLCECVRVNLGSSNHVAACVGSSTNAFAVSRIKTDSTKLQWQSVDEKKRKEEVIEQRASHQYKLT